MRCHEVDYKIIGDDMQILFWRMRLLSQADRRGKGPFWVAWGT